MIKSCFCIFRLWGDHGQSALESARVCLINATATGTEILKNLILPGIGSFTVVDGNKVQGEDAGNKWVPGLNRKSLNKLCVTQTVVT